MEPAILGVLVLILTVMLYLDRSRRNEIRDLRQEMNAGFAEHREETARLREDMNTGFGELRKEIRSSAERTDARIDQLTATVINLAESLGQVKGRSEALVATE